MSRVQFLRLLLLLPLAVPIAAFGLIQFGPKLPELIGGGAAILSFSGLLAGGPYLLFLAAASLALRGRTAQQHLRFYLLAPLAFIPVFILSFFGLVVLESGIKLLADESWYSAIGFYSGLILGFGYLYVLAAWGIYKLMERRGFFEHAA